MIASILALRSALAGGLILMSPTLLAATSSPPAPRVAASPGTPSARGTTPAAARAAATPAPPPTAGMTPQQVVQAFLQAQASRDDEKAYAYLSSDSKSRTSLKDWSDRAHQVRSTFSAITLVAGEAILIGGGAGNIRSTASPATETGDQAAVKVTYMLPVPNTLHLVKENGRWAIDIQKSLGMEAPPPRTAQTPPAPPKTTPQTPPAPDLSLQCRSNLRQIGIAFGVYALEHNGHLPDASSWTDGLMPYLQSAALLKCPPDSPAESSYAMNAALSGARIADIQHPEDRVLLYETTTTGKNVSGSGSTQPATSPHPNGYLVLLANRDVAFRAERPVVQ